MWTFSFDSTSPSLLPALILTGLALVFWYALNLVTYTFFQADKEKVVFLNALCCYWLCQEALSAQKLRNAGFITKHKNSRLAVS